MDLEGLSTEAKIGKVLLLVGTILRGVVALFLLLALLGFYFGFMAWMSMTHVRADQIFPFLVLFEGLLFVLVLVSAFLGYKAYRFSEAGDHQRAGVWGIVAGVIGGPDVILLVGGLMELLSPEAKVSKPPTGG